MESTALNTAFLSVLVTGRARGPDGIVNSVNMTDRFNNYVKLLFYWRKNLEFWQPLPKIRNSTGCVPVWSTSHQFILHIIVIFVLFYFSSIPLSIPVWREVRKYMWLEIESRILKIIACCVEKDRQISPCLHLIYLLTYSMEQGSSWEAS